MKHNPYVGPRPYARADRHKFYGRNREARDLLALILAERVVLFYAPSGAGKTSLLNAKIIPALEEEGFWVLPTVRVGSELPPGVSDAEIANIFVFNTLMGLSGEAADPAPLRTQSLQAFLEAQIAAREGDDDPLPILIFDQFEELFTTHRHRWHDARDFFIQVRQALQAIPTLGVVFAMREDFVAEMDAYAVLLPRRLRARFRMERLGPKGALEAITRPAEQAGCRYEPGAAEWLVENLRQIKTYRRHADAEERALGPYVEPVQLQVICHRLWEQLPEQPDQLIQKEEILQYGDVDRALIDFYEGALRDAVARTGVSEYRLRRWFGERLITPLGTRGLVLRGDEETEGIPNEAVDILDRHYLIHAEMRGGARWYELTHDRLIDPILESNRRWEEAHETPLRRTAREWAATRNDLLLYRGALLREAQAWAEANPDLLTEEEAAFLKASWEKERFRARLRRIRRALTATGLALSLIITFLAWWAIRQSLIARSRELAATSRYYRRIDRRTSIALARQAVEIGHPEVTGRRAQLLHAIIGDLETIQGEMALRQALEDVYPVTPLTATHALAYDVAYSPDSRYLYAPQLGGDVQRWDVERHTTTIIPSPLRAYHLIAAALSHDGRMLATGGYDRLAHQPVVAVWDTVEERWFDTQLRVIPPRGWRDNVLSLDFSPDDVYLAGGGTFVRIWRVARSDGDLRATLVLTLPRSGGTAQAVAYGTRPLHLRNGDRIPLGYLAVAYEDATIRLWQLRATHQTITATAFLTLTGHTGAVRALAFSPTEPLLASASEDKTIRLWDLTRGQAILTLVGHEAEVTSLAFSADGQTLLSGSRDLTVRLWSVGTRTPYALIVLTGPSNVVLDVALSPNGRYIAAASGEDTMRLWDRAVAREWQLSTLAASQRRMRRVAFSPDGRFLVSGDDGGVVKVWAWRTGQVIRTIHASPVTLWDVRYSPDGRHIVGCSEDGRVYVWDATTGQRYRILDEHTRDVNAVAFRSDGHYMVTGSDDQTAILWETATWRAVATLKLPGNTGKVFDVAYSPDGRWIATAHTDDNVRLWEMADVVGIPQINRVITLTGHTNDIFGLAFTPDGRYLASASWDDTVRLWDMASFTTTLILQHPAYVYSVAFSPDGRYMATGSRDRQVRLWDMSRFPEQSPMQIAVLEGHADLVWHVAFSPDGRHLVSSAWDGLIRRHLVRFEDVWAYSEHFVAPP